MIFASLPIKAKKEAEKQRKKIVKENKKRQRILAPRRWQKKGEKLGGKKPSSCELFPVSEWIGFSIWHLCCDRGNVCWEEDFFSSLFSPKRKSTASAAT